MTPGKAGSSDSLGLLFSWLSFPLVRLSPSGSFPELTLYLTCLVTLSEGVYLSFDSCNQSPRLSGRTFFFFNCVVFEFVTVIKNIECHDWPDPGSHGHYGVDLLQTLWTEFKKAKGNCTAAIWRRGSNVSQVNHSEYCSQTWEWGKDNCVQDNYYSSIGWRPWMRVEMAIGFLTPKVEVDSGWE